MKGRRSRDFWEIKRRIPGQRSSNFQLDLVSFPPPTSSAYLTHVKLRSLPLPPYLNFSTGSLIESLELQVLRVNEQKFSLLKVGLSWNYAHGSCCSDAVQVGQTHFSAPLCVSQMTVKQSLKRSHSATYSICTFCTVMCYTEKNFIA